MVPTVACNYNLVSSSSTKAVLPSTCHSSVFRRRLGAFAVGQIFSQCGIEKYSNLKILWLLTDLLCTKIEELVLTFKYLEESTEGEMGGFRVNEMWEEYKPTETEEVDALKAQDSVEIKVQENTETQGQEDVDSDIDALFHDYDTPQTIEQTEDIKPMRIRRPLHYNRLLKTVLILHLGALCPPPLSSSVPLGRGLGRGEKLQDLICYSRLQRKWMTTLLRKLSSRLGLGETKLILPEALLTILKNCPTVEASNPPTLDRAMDFSMDELEGLVSAETLDVIRAHGIQMKIQPVGSGAIVHGKQPVLQLEVPMKQKEIERNSSELEGKNTNGAVCEKFGAGVIEGNFHPTQQGKKEYFFGLDSSSIPRSLELGLDLTVDASLLGMATAAPQQVHTHPYTLSRLATPILQSHNPSPYVLSPFSSTTSLPQQLHSETVLLPSYEETVPLIPSKEVRNQLIRLAYYTDTYKPKPTVDIANEILKRRENDKCLIDYELSIAKMYVRELVFQQAATTHRDGAFILNHYMGAYPKSSHSETHGSLRHVFRLFMPQYPLYTTLVLSSPFGTAGIWPSSSTLMLPQYADVGLGLTTFITLTLLTALSESAYDYFGYRSRPHWIKEILDHAQEISDDSEKKMFNSSDLFNAPRKKTALITPSLIHRAEEPKRIEKLSLSHKLAQARSNDDTFENLKKKKPLNSGVSLALKVKLNAAKHQLAQPRPSLRLTLSLKRPVSKPSLKITIKKKQSITDTEKRSSSTGAESQPLVFFPTSDNTQSSSNLLIPKLKIKIPSKK